MSRRFYIAGFAFGLLGIILGAFATHGLKPVLTPAAMESFQTGVEYQIYHALLLIIIGNFNPVISKFFSLVFYLLVSGIILFSGSIFLLSTNALTTPDFRFLGPITPLGGSLLILCWIFLLIYALKLKKK